MVITRFPPSPTGYLHLGGARTALFNWLFARKHKGKFILRFEDTDLERSKKEYVDAILEALNWLGLNWDEGPYFQTERFSRYQEVAEKLVAEGKAYYCECSKELLEKKKKEMMERGLKPRYDGTCRNLNLGKAPGRVVRIKVPDLVEIAFEDLLRGKIVFPPDEVDDFIILRADGTPTYNFAVVVDDIDMKITHVIRGDDHISNTPKQLIVYQLLGVEPPKFAHIPMVLGQDGARLSKRHGARSILEYREEGYLPQAVVNYLARLGWGYGDQEYFTVEELIEKFELSRINLSPARFDPDKFLAINAYWIRNLPEEELLPHLKPFISSLLSKEIDPSYLFLAIKSLKPRVKTLKELAENMVYFLTEDYPMQEDALKKHLTPSIKPHLEAFCELLPLLNLEDEKESEMSLRRFAEERGIKLKDLAQAIRVALTGKTVSPPLFEVMRILGKERVERRIKRALNMMG